MRAKALLIAVQNYSDSIHLRTCYLRFQSKPFILWFVKQNFLTRVALLSDR